MRAMEQVDIAVVGGGLTGASLATALAREPRLRGRKVLVLEARAGKNPRFAGELIHPTGVQVLEDNGLLGGLHAIEERARLVSYTAAVLVEDTALPHDRYGHIFLGAPGPILAYPIEGAGSATSVRMCIDVPTPLLEANKGTAALTAVLR